jgi:hypothetical protein
MARGRRDWDGRAERKPWWHKKNPERPGFFKGLPLVCDMLGSTSNFSAAKAFSKPLDFSVSLQKHNRWSRVIPPGVTCTDLKNQLIRTTLIERERSVCRLVLDTAEPELFTVTVKFIADSLGFSASKQWPKVRDLLVQKGILVCNAEKLGGGQQRWHLNFDFTPLASGLLDREKKLSTPDAKKGGSRARACDPPHLGGSRDLAALGGSRDPAALGGLELEALEQEKPTSKSKAAAFLLLEKQTCLAAATSADKYRIAAELAKAVPAQIDAFFGVLSARVSGGKVNDLVSYAVSLAKLASSGQLALDAVLPPSAAEVCAAKATWRGDLRSPAGVVAVAKLDASMGQLRSPNGPLFSIADSSLFWLRVDEGELDFVSATMSIP